jgi:hypothetical protein
MVGFVRPRVEEIRGGDIRGWRNLWGRGLKRFAGEIFADGEICEAEG